MFLVLAILRVSVKNWTHGDTKNMHAPECQVMGCLGFELMSLVLTALKVSVKKGTHGDTKNACSRVSG